MKLRELYKNAVYELSLHGILNPNLEARFLLESIARISTRDILINGEIEISSDIESEFIKCIERRNRREPIQYILGKYDFWSYTFVVKRGVFIPRPETELIIENLLKIYNTSYKDQFVDILDMCTGCGNIAITAAYELKKSRVLGVDISEDAISLANINKGDLTNVQFIKGDLFSTLSMHTRVDTCMRNYVRPYKFDFILSNPPYVKSFDISTLSREVVEFEPRIALDGDDDGLKILREIILTSPEYLKDSGYLICEIGYDEGERVLDLAKNYSQRFLLKDLSGQDRILIAHKRDA